MIKMNIFDRFSRFYLKYLYYYFFTYKDPSFPQAIRYYELTSTSSDLTDALVVYEPNLYPVKASHKLILF